ncbi:MAG: hypothetical protein EOP82_13520 [Variovorax sp.]|nr:MAG: hypothetical protein EOP82_13520 [Variovorax sp.]
MIVLKATQDKVLAALESVAGIVRRLTVPILSTWRSENFWAFGPPATKWFKKAGPMTHGPSRPVVH